jgi:hypothetical protein
MEHEAGGNGSQLVAIPCIAVSIHPIHHTCNTGSLCDFNHVQTRSIDVVNLLDESSDVTVACLLLLFDGPIKLSEIQMES